jgi:hypothetical protein
MFSSAEDMLSIRGEGDMVYRIGVLEYGNSSLIRKPPKANLVIFRCGCEKGASRVQGNHPDYVSMALPGFTDLLPGR